MDIEAVLLTGGASRRMGADKAGLRVQGEAVSIRIARELSKTCDPVTVLGRAAIEGYEFLADEGEYEGPLVALSRFVPTKDYVFVASCDLPQFDASIVTYLRGHIAAYEAIVPSLSGRSQPLCALYRSEAFDSLAGLVEGGERRMMAWLDSLRSTEVAAEELPNPAVVRNANTPDEWRRAVDSSS